LAQLAADADRAADVARHAQAKTDTELAHATAELHRVHALAAELEAEAGASRMAAGALEATVKRMESEMHAERAEWAATVAESQREATARAQAEALCLALQLQIAEASKVAEAATSSKDAMREERDALRLQLANFSERASVLPDFYAQQIFVSDTPPEDFMAALTNSTVSDRDGAPAMTNELAEEIRERAGQAAQDLATSHLGNIAALTSWGVKRATPFAQRTWSSLFGDATEVEAETSQLAPAGAAEAQKREG